MQGTPNAVRRGDPVAAAPREEPIAAAPGRTAIAPAAPVANGGEGDVANVERDLAALSQALVMDQRIEDRVMPRINDVLDVPGVTSYRRAPDFWESALGGSGGMHR